MSAWIPPEDPQNQLRVEYIDLLERERAGAIDRDLGRAHITGSAVVISPDLTDVLLCLHKRAGMWLQLGGHIEAGDDSVSATAQREATEEAGLGTLRLLSANPVDLDRHALGPGFVRCDTHWDIGYVFIGDGDPTRSDESDAVQWWPVARLPQNIPPRLPQRIHRAVDAARTLLER